MLVGGGGGAVGAQHNGIFLEWRQAFNKQRWVHWMNDVGGPAPWRRRDLQKALRRLLSG